jgi:hypothetical protein
MLSHNRGVHIETLCHSGYVIERDEALLLARAHAEVLAGMLLLFGGTLDADDGAIEGALRVEAFNLELVKLYEELFDEVIEHVVAFTHELCRLLLSH